MRLFSKLLAAMLLLVVLAALLHARWLPLMADYLVKQDGPCKGEIVVVLAGGSKGNRILKGGELVRDGYAPKALVSSPSGHYGLREADLAIPFAVKHGFPPDYFDAFPVDADSTREEAVQVLAELGRRGIRHFVLLSSEYHTRRCGRIYRELARDMTFCVVGAPDPDFRRPDWWKDRRSQKTIFYEWVKVVTGVFGI